MASKKEGFGRGGSAHRLKKAGRDRVLKGKKASGANPSQVKASNKKSKSSRPAAAAGPNQGKKSSDEIGSSDKVKVVNVEADYRTVLDEIYEFVEQQGETTLTELSKKTNIPASRLEDWAKVFDKEGLLELDYPMVGDIIVRKEGYAEEQKKAKHPEKKAKAERIRDNIAGGVDVSKIEAAKPAEPKAELTDEEKKLKSKKAMRLAMFGIGAVIVALIGVLAYFLVKGGYIQFV